MSTLPPPTPTALWFPNYSQSRKVTASGTQILHAIWTPHFCHLRLSQGGHFYLERSLPASSLSPQKHLPPCCLEQAQSGRLKSCIEPPQQCMTPPQDILLPQGSHSPGWWMMVSKNQVGSSVLSVRLLPKLTPPGKSHRLYPKAVTPGSQCVPCRRHTAGRGCGNMLWNSK